MIRRSIPLLRGAKGYNWYKKFVEKGADGFTLHTPPTPFNWLVHHNSSTTRSKAFIDLKIDNEELGRMIFELANDVVPKTVENFTTLIQGKGVNYPGSNKGYSGSYKNTKVHQVIKGVGIMCGDVENNDGSGNHSSKIEKYIPDENFIIPHSERGLLSMASIGIHTNGSQFYIANGVNKHMNGRCVVFGRLISGEEVLAAVEKVYTFRGLPSRNIVITNCGLLEDSELPSDALKKLEVN